MKISKIFFPALLMLVLALINCQNKNSGSVLTENPVEQIREFYQLKTYVFDNDEQVRVTDEYLKNAFLPALKKLEINQVGVFKSGREEADTVRKTYVLIPLVSLDQLNFIEDKLSTDSTYLIAGKEYINASYDRPPYRRIESTLLKAFEEMPMMQLPALDGPRAQRIYELRSYESPTEAYYKNKVKMFNQGGEVKLFDRLNFNAVFYAEVISGSKMPNLMYMTTFSDQESHDAHWEAFFSAPEWLELKSMPQYQNNVSHADIMLLYPTEYSDY
jgi:hypothetical protein